jgi:hypothetical protein
MLPPIVIGMLAGGSAICLRPGQQRQRRVRREGWVRGKLRLPIQRLIALMALCCDPLAIALTAAAINHRLTPLLTLD